MHPVLAINRVSGRWPVALKASIAVGGPVMAAALLGETRLGLMTGLGAFAILYAPYTAGRLRLKVVATVAAGLTLSAALGAVTHDVGWLNVAVMTALAVAASAIGLVLKVGPPGAYFFPLVAGIAAYSTQQGARPWLVVGLAAVGGVVALAVGMLDLLWTPRGAELKALDGAERAVATFQTAGPSDLAEARALASQSLHHAWTTVSDGSGPRPSRAVLELQSRLVGLQTRYEHRSAMASGQLAGFQVHPWGDTEGEESDDESTLVGFDEEQLRDSSLGRPDPGYLFRHGLTWPSEILLVCARVAVAAVLTGAIALALSIAHPYWAVAFAVLVLHQGGARSAQVVRGLQRLLGTVVGLGLYWVVLQWSPTGVWLALLLMAFQFVIELLVVRNYAAAVVFITPLALTIAHAVGGQTPTLATILERGLDTVLAVAVALTVLFAVGRHTTLLFARAHARRVVVAMDPVLRALAEGRVDSPESAQDRRHLYFELLELQRMVGQSMTDEPLQIRPYQQMFNAVATLGYAILGACWHPESERASDAAARARTALDRITRHPVSEYRAADAIQRDVAAAQDALRDWR